MMELFEVETFARIDIGNKRLDIVWGARAEGLGCYVNTDEELEDLINNNFEQAYLWAFKEFEDNHYLLNIQSTVPYNNISWEGRLANNLMQRQLKIFMPIIRKWMADA